MNIEDRLQQVRAEYLRRISQGDSTLLRQVQHHLASRTGKMLRPRILLLAAATLGPDRLLAPRTLLLAVAVEMLHNASLLHDDVIDRSPTRRGQPSVNARWNNAVAVLVGDYLLALVMQLLDEINDPDAARLVNQTVLSMVQAELLAQQLDTDNSHLTPDNYLTIIDGKTANLFATAAALGNPAYRDFGLHYGRLFQLRDDIDDHEENSHTRQLIQQEENAIKNLPIILNI